MSNRSALGRTLLLAVLTFVLAITAGDTTSVAGETRGSTAIVKAATTTDSGAPGASKSWSFDHDRGYLMPGDWTAVSGNWKVLLDMHAPSLPNTLSLPGYGLPRTKAVMLWIDSFFSDTYLLAIPKDSTEYSDLSLQADIKPWGGAWGSYAGLVVRYTDPQDYYVLAAACPKDYVALYRMSGGRLTLIKEAPAELERGRWYALRLDARGDHFSAYLNGKQLFEAQDSGLAKGRIGVWSQNDSRVSFDNVKVTAESAPGA
ncbi:MAG TPA: family 16 glycoside hydrolase [Candidatus Binataceae bacterium]|jgi:hypothetical protein|nr:family 16 glycoside hydrolase [Candidatus Binataceae bacterium]